MRSHTPDSPTLFKGIALFTPGGDLVYCIDPDKQNRWHLHLCAVLQEMLGLTEPPHFLVPCYAATVDRWRDLQTQQIHTVAEAASPVLKYQALLNAVFGTGDLVWQPAPLPEAVCDPVVRHSYRSQFPQLWETHDLIVRYEPATPYTQVYDPSQHSIDPSRADAQGYVLRLFVSGHSAATERTLQNLHQLLEQALGHPYTLKVIDVLQHPDRAELDQVSATPTLVKVWPRPVRRIVGNLESIEQLLRVLGPLEERQDELD